MSQTDECISNLKIHSCPSCYTTTILRSSLEINTLYDMLDSQNLKKKKGLC